MTDEQREIVKHAQCLQEVIKQLVGTDDERWESRKRLKAWMKEIRESEQGSEIEPVGQAS